MSTVWFQTIYMMCSLNFYIHSYYCYPMNAIYVFFYL